MASLGDVNFRIRASTEGFTSAMLGAAKSLDTLERDVRQLQADFRAGRVHIEEYRRSMAALNEQARSVRTGIGQIAFQDLPRLKSILEQTTPAAEKAGLTLRSLRSPLASLAADAAGVQGPLGSLGGMLVSLGTGGAWGLAAIAGIGAIAFAMKKLGEDTAAAHKEYTDYIATLQKNTPLAIVGREMDDLQAKFDRLTKLENFGRPDQPFFEAGGYKELKRVGDALRIVKEQYDQIRDSLTDTSEHLSDIPKAPVIDFLDGIAAAARDADFAIKDVMANGARLGRNLGALAGFGSGATVAEQAAMTAAANSRTGLISGIEGVGKSQFTEDEIAKALAAAEDLGKSMSRSIAAGLVSGGGIGNALKNVFRAALETIISELIKPFLTQLAATVLGALGKGAGGKFGIKDIIGAGVGVGISVLTGGIFSRSSETVINVPASRSPMDQARDAFWLSTMSETMRALQSNNSLRVVYTR